MSKVMKKDLPEVLETELEDRDQAVIMLERAVALQSAIAEGEAELSKIKESLSQIAVLGGVEGLRHNNIAFTVRLNPGRVTTDGVKFTEYLVSHGVPAATIQDATEHAKKVGEPYYVRDIKLLK